MRGVGRYLDDHVFSVPVYRIEDNGSGELVLYAVVTADITLARAAPVPAGSCELGMNRISGYC